MVVFNFDMRVELRVQKPAGRRAVLAVSGMMSNPLRTVQRKPLTKHIADSLAKHGKALQSLAPEISTPGRPDAIAKIDANFVHVMEGAARYEAPSATYVADRARPTVASCASGGRKRATALPAAFASTTMCGRSKARTAPARACCAFFSMRVDGSRDPGRNDS